MDTNTEWMKRLMIRWKFSRVALHPLDNAGHARLSAMKRRQTLTEYRELKVVLQNNKCFYCTQEMIPPAKNKRKHPKKTATADHLIPSSKGGKTTLDNIVAACLGCNTAKGTQDWYEFLRTRHPLSRELRLAAAKCDKKFNY
jgi:hypothetical protein